jgi:carbon monoxide dehydrogenase subunit G
MADRTSSSITINAAKHAVMAAIADFETYPKWADGIKSAEVVAHGQDRAERVRFVLEAGPISDEYVLSYEWDGDDAVVWRLAERGKMLADMTGSYRLAEQADGAILVTYELAVEVAIPMIGMLKRKVEKRIIDTALKGLKRHVEAG